MHLNAGTALQRLRRLEREGKVIGFRPGGNQSILWSVGPG